MAGRKTASSASIPHGIPSDLPDDGTPFKIITTTEHRKVLGDPTVNEAGPQITPKDFENAEWNVYLQTGRGYAFVDKVRGRPYDPDIRDVFGPGSFRSIPIGPDGKPIDAFAQNHRIKDPTSPNSNGVANADGTKKTPEEITRDWLGKEEMPAWMRLQIQQATEEKAEARRRADESEIKRQEWERTQSQRDFDKAERQERETRERRLSEEKERKERMELLEKERQRKDDLEYKRLREEREDRRQREERIAAERERKEEAERERRLEAENDRQQRYDRELAERREKEDKDRAMREAKEARESEERRLAADRQASMLTAGVSIATAFLENRNSQAPVAQAPRSDLNEQLLTALVTRPEPVQQQKENVSMKDQIDILLALDSLRKPEPAPPAPEPEKKSDIAQIAEIAGSLGPALPGILGMLGIGGGGAAKAQAMMEAAGQMQAQPEPPQGYLPPTPGNGQAQIMPGQDPSALVLEALQNPALLSKLAMANPDGIAQSLVAAVQGNEVLKASVVKAFEGMEG
ncbi:MAG: hypothetical protein HN929_06100 [Chloroflexi bacterium]|jgi:hypothetical protein|nr:hypothetical protein [Chloroflexota bacterium]